MLDFIKTKHSCASKDSINSKKATHGMGENLCQSYIR